MNNAIVKVSTLKWGRAFAKMIRARVGLPPTLSSPENPIRLNTRSQTFYLNRREKIISTFKDPADAKLIKEAFDLAWEGHQNQFRKSGDLYIEHPLWVAEKLAEFGLGAEEIAAGLCHDLIEDVKIGERRINENFLSQKLSPRVALIVQGVTELGKEPEFSRGQKIAHVDIVKKWLEFGQKDLATVIVKLFDRWHNMLTLDYTKKETQVFKAEETLNIYTKIAGRLGIWFLKTELEDLAFKFLQPERHQALVSKIEESKRLNKIIIKNLRDALAKRINVTAEVLFETRGIYELSQRIEKKKIIPENISPSDIWRCMVIVQEESEVYQSLSAITHLFPPVHGSLRDYISDPRPNGHRFLHFWVRAPRFGQLLIQIRTKSMQKYHELGVLTKVHGRKWYKKTAPWLIAIAEELKTEETSEPEVWQIIAAQSQPIKVYSPKAEAFELPFGATALDFARKIHEQLFLTAASAIINGRPEEVTSRLHDGDMVQIITDPAAEPPLIWIDYLQTPEAKSSLRNYLKKKLEKEQGAVIKSAIEAIDHYAQKYYLTGKQLLSSLLFLKNYHQPVEDFLVKVGIGRIKPLEVVSHLASVYQKELKIAKEQGIKLQTLYLSIEAENRIGLIDDLAHPLKKLQFNISDLFPIYKEKDKATIILGVDIIEEKGLGRILSEIQRFQVINIIQIITGSKATIIDKEKVKEYLKYKLDKLK